MRESLLASRMCAGELPLIAVGLEVLVEAGSSRERFLTYGARMGRGSVRAGLVHRAGRRCQFVRARRVFARVFGAILIRKLLCLDSLGCRCQHHFARLGLTFAQRHVGFQELGRQCPSGFRKDSTGMTPLHVAASGNVSTAAVLCRLRAKVDATDNQGKTPLDVALDAQNADMITLLRLAKLVKEGGGLDDKSFAEALDSFSMEVHARQPAPASSKSLRASSPSRKTSAHPTSVASSSPPTSASNSALSTSPEADLSSSAPTPASSFSFSSKLDKKK